MIRVTNGSITNTVVGSVQRFPSSTQMVTREKPQSWFYISVAPGIFEISIGSPGGSLYHMESLLSLGTEGKNNLLVFEATYK